MQTLKIEFHELADCIEFLDTVLRNERRLQIKLRDVTIEVADDGDRSLFLVLIENLSDTAADRLLKLVRCTDCLTSGDLSRGGEPLKVSQLLERVGLTLQPNMPAEQPAAVLLFRAGQDDFRRRYTQLIDCGCRGIRVGLVQPSEENQYLSHVLFVDSPSKAFNPSVLTVGETAGGIRAVISRRFRPAADCKLYIEWGYEYPFERVEQLYDFDNPRCHSVFCIQSPKSDDSVGLRWIRLRDEDAEDIFSLAEKVLHLDDERSRRVVDLKPLELNHELSFPVQVIREARGSTASLDALEMQIAHHQQVIADLQRDYGAAHALRRDSLFLAYVFEQDLTSPNGKPPRLNTLLARFLDQPYAQLEKMRYGFFQHPEEEDSGLHVVFDDRPAEHGQLLTSLANEIYVQRAAWAKWELPLYVRRGDEVRPRLEEQGVGEKFRKLLWGNEHPTHEAVLLRSTRNRNADGELPWEAIYIRDPMPLTDSACVQFLNDRFSSAVLEFRRQVPEELENALRELSVPLAETGETLVKQIDDAITRRIDDAEERWRTVDERVTEIQRKVEQHDRAVVEADASITCFPGTWAAFVSTVLTANNNLLQPKVEAWKDYSREQKNLENLVENYHSTTTNVKHEVAANIKNVEDRRNAYRVTEQQTEQLLSTLTTEVRKFRDEQREAESKLAEHHKKADAQVKQVQMELEDLKKLSLDLHNKKRVLEQFRRNAEQERTEQQKLLNDLESEERKYKTTQAKLQTEKEDYTAKLVKLNSDRSKLEEEKRKVEALAAGVHKEEDSHNAAMNRLNEEYRQHQKRLLQLQEQLQSLQDRRARMSALVEQVASIASSIDPRDMEPDDQPGVLAVKVANMVPKDLLDLIRDRSSSR